MVHFFPKFSARAAGTPFGQEILSSDIEHRFFSSQVQLGYGARLALVLPGWPRPIWMAVRVAVRSVVLARPCPDAVLLDWHFKALPFGALHALRHRTAPRIVLLAAAR